MKHELNRCQYCNFPSRLLDEDRDGHYCRAELRCYNRLLRQLNAERRRAAIGKQMANALFNFQQGTPISQHMDTVDRMRREWDTHTLDCKIESFS